MIDHTPIPDGKTGPFMRKPHNKITPEGAGYAYDPRCPQCRIDRAMEITKQSREHRARSAAEKTRQEGMR